MKQLTFLILLLPLQVPLLAQVTMEQSVLASAGEHSTSGSLALTWTLGETATETYIASGLTVAQGFHQGGVVEGTHDARLPFEVEVFPNPTSLTLYVTAAAANKPLVAELVSLDGRILLTQQLDFPIAKSPISMAALPASTYFLVLKDETGLFTSFKIQKL